MSKKEVIKLHSRSAFVLHLIGAISAIAFATLILLVTFYLAVDEMEIYFRILISFLAVPLLYVAAMVVVRLVTRKIILDYLNNEIIIRKGVFAGWFLAKKCIIGFKEIKLIEYKLEKDFYSTGGGSSLNTFEDRNTIFFVLGNEQVIDCDGYYSPGLITSSRESNSLKTKEIAEKLNAIIQNWRAENNIEISPTQTPSNSTSSNE